MVIKALHPGERLAEELEALKMSADELARNLAVPNKSAGRRASDR